MPLKHKMNAVKNKKRGWICHSSNAKVCQMIKKKRWNCNNLTDPQHFPSKSKSHTNTRIVRHFGTLSRLAYIYALQTQCCKTQIKRLKFQPIVSFWDAHCSTETPLQTQTQAKAGQSCLLSSFSLFRMGVSDG